jgi:uncharacterized membrane protein
MNMRLATLIGVVLALAAAAVGLWHWSDLPASVPVHWDGAGHPDRYGSRLEATMLMPTTMLVLSLVFAVLPKISPIGFSLHRFEGALARMSVATGFFLLLVHMETLHAASTGRPLSVSVLTAGIGALLAMLGNQFGKVRRNFFIGVRTPWTLADEEVWLRTHRLAGKLLCVAGLLMMVLSLFTTNVITILGPVLSVSLVSIVYSFVIYRRLHPSFRH